MSIWLPWCFWLCKEVIWNSTSTWQWGSEFLHSKYGHTISLETEGCISLSWVQEIRGLLFGLVFSHFRKSGQVFYSVTRDLPSHSRCWLLCRWWVPVVVQYFGCADRTLLVFYPLGGEWVLFLAMQFTYCTYPRDCSMWVNVLFSSLLSLLTGWQCVSCCKS